MSTCVRRLAMGGQTELASRRKSQFAKKPFQCSLARVSFPKENNTTCVDLRWEVQRCRISVHLSASLSSIKLNASHRKFTHGTVHISYIIHDHDLSTENEMPIRWLKRRQARNSIPVTRESYDLDTPPTKQYRTNQVSRWTNFWNCWVAFFCSSLLLRLLERGKMVTMESIDLSETFPVCRLH